MGAMMFVLDSNGRYAIGSTDRANLTFDFILGLLTEYQDVFPWSYNDMKGLDPQYYQHQIHL